MKSKPNLRSFLAASGTSLLAISSAHAANANWTGGGGDALWSNTANWSASPVPGTGNTATFNAAAGAGGTVIDLGAGVTVNTISFVSVGTPSTLAAYTIGAGAVNSQSLILNGSGNAGLASSGTATTAQITINAAITVNNSQQWVLNQGANPWIINGSVTPNGISGSTIQVKINGHSATFNGILADQAGGAKFQIAGSNAQTATLTNSNNSFTGGLVFDNGNVSVNSIGMIGSNSAAGAGGDLLFGSGFGGGALIYTGTGNTTDRVVKINHGYHGATITQSGTGNLKFTADMTFAAASTAVGSEMITLNGSTAGTGEFSGKLVDNGTTGLTPLKTGVILGATSLNLHSVDGIKVGSAVTGTGFAPGTTVTAINATSKTVTLSTGTTAAIAQSANISVADVVNITHLTKNGSGTWTLSGANTHSGFTKISAGTLTLANSLALQNSPIDMVGSIAGTASAGLKTTVTALTLGGLSGTVSPKNLSSIFTTTSGGYNGVTALTLNPSTGASHSYSGVIADGASGMILNKTGSGTQILGGNNTYTGATNVTGGTLALSGTGSISNSPRIQINTSTTLSVTGLTGGFTIGSSQTVAGNGTILATGKTVTANGTLSPGNSPGTLVQDGGTLQLGVGGDLNWQIHDVDGAAGTGYDTVNLTNGATLDLSLLSTVNPYNINLWSLSGIGPDVNGNAINFDNTQNYTWTLFSTGTAIAGFDPSYFNLVIGANNGTSGFSNALGGGAFSVGLADSNTDLVLNFTAVPEPRAALLGGIGLLALLRRRRG